MDWWKIHLGRVCSRPEKDTGTVFGLDNEGSKLKVVHGSCDGQTKRANLAV